MNNESAASVTAMLVNASRILARKQILDGFGHVSVRHPEHPDRFLISRNMAPALVNPDDIMTIDFLGESCGGDERKPFLERFLHGAIYHARADVGAIVHSHSPSVIPFGVVRDTPLRPVFHMAGFLQSQAPVFEIRDAVGEASDMLVRTTSIASCLARTLGDSAVVLMRGHGSTIVGQNLRAAVFRAIYLELNARVQCDAMRLGTVTYLNAAEASNADAANLSQVDRAWDLWCREL